MNKHDTKILAIETSCDETAAAVISVQQNNNPVILSNIVSSQANLHAKTGGIVPEVASRAHMEAMMPVISLALIQAQNQKSKINPSRLRLAEAENQNYDSMLGQVDNLTIKHYNNAISTLKNEIDYVAITVGPGLIGSLLVGFNAAKTIAYALNKPVIPVNHIEGHIYSAFCREVSNDEFQFPIIALTVSGGHTSLTLMKDHGQYENIGQTIDDAAGEAFDKVAKLLDLGYPGGPAVSKLASQFRANNYPEGISFPRPIINDGTFNFSFSGLKTAVRQAVINLTDNGKKELTKDQKGQICAAFEDAAVDVLVTKSLRAVKKYNPKTFVLAGGVAANSHLRKTFEETFRDEKSALIMPPLELCGDNAAMIGLAAFYHVLRNNISSWDKISIDSNLEL